MTGNLTLNTARYTNGTDEWYTTYETIAKELKYYSDKFFNKVVLCNCDNPHESNFAYYFLKNFNILGLKKLICTSFSKHNEKNVFKSTFFSDDWSYFDDIDDKRGYLLEIDNIAGDSKEEVPDEIIINILTSSNIVKRLKGEGDFRSVECVEYLKECDICCTNPPFSLFSDLFSLIIKYKKDFLLIGNQNALTYKNVFPYVKQNKVWVGYGFGDMSFRVPDNTEPRKTRFWIDERGHKWRSLGNAMWLTNLDIPKRNTSLALKQSYCPDLYPSYDNFDAIHVSKVADIPFDYPGIMGVPVTFLKYYNDSQFEIIGEANHGSDNEYDLFKPIIDGREVFKRILIRKK